MRLLTPLAMLFVAAAWAGEEPPKALSPEARKNEYAALQKELEASRPIQGATREEALAYVELAVDKYAKFARDNPQSAEGFEAALTLATLLSQIGHKDALKSAELAIAAAPKAGVDVKRIALCWAMVAFGRLQKEDAAGAREALGKIKPLDAEIYKQLVGQFDEAEKQLAAAREATARLQPGKEPFPIEGQDTAGKAVSLAGFKGKVVVVDFWASWCEPCMQEMPGLVKLYKEQHARGLEVLGISLDKDEESLQNAVQEQGIAWPVIFDSAGGQHPIAGKWAIRSIPATFVLDRKGIIRHVNLRGEELAQAVAKLLEEKP